MVGRSLSVWWVSFWWCNVNDISLTRNRYRHIAAVMQHFLDLLPLVMFSCLYFCQQNWRLTRNHKHRWAAAKLAAWANPWPCQHKHWYNSIAHAWSYLMGKNSLKYCNFDQIFTFWGAVVTMLPCWSRPNMAWDSIHTWSMLTRQISSECVHCVVFSWPKTTILGKFWHMGDSCTNAVLPMRAKFDVLE